MKETKKETKKERNKETNKQTNKQTNKPRKKEKRKNTSHFKHVMQPKLQDAKRTEDVQTFLKRKSKFEASFNLPFHDTTSMPKLAEVDEWYAQFCGLAKPRYSFLVMVGESKLGKSQFVYNHTYRKR